MTFEHRGVTVQVLRMHHGRGRPKIQNLGFLIEIGEVRFLHVGDTELTAAERRAFDLANRDITVALLPSWQVKEKNLHLIGGQHVAAFHLAEADPPASWFGPYASRSERVTALNSLPGVTVFSRPGEELAFSN